MMSAETQMKLLKTQLITAELQIEQAAEQGDLELVELYDKLRSELEAELRALESE